MKLTNINQFKKNLTKDQQVIVILASEAADREAALGLALQGEAVQFDAEKATPSQVIQELESFSLFGDSNAVVVTHIEKGTKPLLDALSQAVERGGKPLYIVGAKLNGSTKLYKRSVEKGIVLDIPQLKSWELEKQLPIWAQQEAQRLGKKMASQAAYTLVQQVGTDKTLLQREIEKLICYLGERGEVVLDDIRAICTVNSGATGWDLGNAVFREDKGTAMAIGRDLLRSGLFVGVVLRQLRNQFQTDLQVWSIMSSGGSPQDVTKEFGYLRGRPLEQHLDNARRFGGGRLKRGLILIDEADLKSKNSQISPELLLDRLLAKV